MRRFPLLAVTLLAIAALLPATPAAATGPQATVSAYLGDCEAFGTASLLTTDTLVVRHLRPDGTLKAKHTVVVSGGEWDWACPGPNIRAGDKLQLIRKGETTPFRVVTVPKLTVRPDRVGDVVRGSTPGNEAALVRLVRLECDPADYGCGTTEALDFEAAPDGSYSLPVVALTGRNHLDLDWTYLGDTFTLTQHVAALQVRPGSPRVTGWGSKVGQALTVTLKRGSKVVKAVATTRSDASYTAVLRKNGTPFTVKANDVIRASFATDAVMTVPTITIGLLEAGVFGVCFPNAQAIYLLRDGDGQNFAYGEIDTDEDGY